jgi:hypothetical protein
MSTVSRIFLKVDGLPVILTTGAIGDPTGVPLPVVKTMICAPPANMPVMEFGHSTLYFCSKVEAAGAATKKQQFLTSNYFGEFFVYPLKTS